MRGRQDNEISTKDYLNQLKQVFDSIETYDVTDNVGYRSLKNLGVWLIAYGLTEPQDKARVVEELATKANFNADQAGILHEVVNHLSAPVVLAEVIKDYEKANGKFQITLKTDAQFDRLCARAVELGYADIVLGHASVKSKQDADLVFEMNNEINFKWSTSKNSPIKLVPSEDRDFRNVGKIRYLSSVKKMSTDYNVVECKGRFYHVARIGTLEADSKNRTHHGQATFIEPVNPNDVDAMQSDWLDILNAFEYPSGTEGYFKMQEVLKKLGLHNIQVTETGMDAALKSEERWIGVDYRANLHIPALQGTIKTRETRLGAYAHFEGKTIGGIYASEVSYLGLRELEYNEEGGKIKNTEAMGVCESACHPPAVHVTVEYAVSGPFMFAYQANYGADYYSYFIADPTRNLEKQFDSSQAYKSRAMSGTMFSKSEKTEAAVVHAPTLK